MLKGRYNKINKTIYINGVIRHTKTKYFIFHFLSSKYETFEGVYTYIFDVMDCDNFLLRD